MKKLLKISVSLVLVTMISFSCKKENEGPLIFVSPNATQINLAPNTLMEFSINIQAQAGLKKLRITRNINNTVTQTVLDSSLSGTNSIITLPYLVPANGVTQVYFVFTLIDNDDRQVSTPRRIVVEGSALLVETTGHVMYSKYAENSLSAFNIASSQIIQLLSTTDSSTVDVRDFDSSDDDVLSKRWSSNNGVEFVRNNSYDYANATFSSAQSTFNSSTSVEILDNISVNDKIIVKYGDSGELFAVFDIIEIYDEAGTDNDRYRFNVKK